MNIVREFEELLESYYPGTKAIAVNSGTSALLACLKSLNLARQHEVITTPFTFQATSDAIILAGGRPRFADITEHEHLIDRFSVSRVVNGETRAIVPVNLFGRIGMRSHSNQNTFHLPIIEDSAQCFLHPDNLNTLSDAQCFSFYRSKNLQCGEGGAIVVTEHGKLDYEKIWSLCNNGRLPGKPRYEHYNIGFNFRMSEHQALMVYNQLKYHSKGIQAELGAYSEKDGYYPSLVYQQPSYQGLRLKHDCPVAESLVQQIRGCN